MSRHLFAAAAVAPLVLAATPALATEISGTQTTGVATSTQGDLAISGAVSSANAAPAVTIDSASVVTNTGTIQTNNVDGSTAVSILGGASGSFTSAGYVYAIEDFTAADANENGISEAPLASGTGRYGVRIWGPGAFTGDLINTGTIAVEGNNSLGVSIESPLIGSVGHTGSIAVTGANSFGLRTTAAVSGDLNLAGAVAASGQNATALQIGGDVGGRLLVYGSISANGYGASSRLTDTALAKLLASEQLTSGAALVVGADVAQGVYIGGAPYGTDTEDTVTDANGDGIVDSLEGTGSVTSIGSAPAVLIGATGRSVSLGAFGTGDNAYGLVLRGAVGAAGLYDGVSATGMQIGGLGGGVWLSGGLRMTGTLNANAYEAAATALHIGAGASIPLLRVENAIAAAVLDSSLTTADTTAAATAIQIDAGGRIDQIVNYGTIAASAVGDAASARAVVDTGGGLSTILNLGAITATVASAEDGGTAAGATVALDLRANTTGLWLRQTANPTPIAVGDATVTAADGTSSTATVYTPSSPSIVGDIYLGSGPNTVELLAGSVAGALNLGSGAARLTIDGGATYSGALTYHGDSLDISVTSGVLSNTSALAVQADSLTVGASGVLRVGVDGANAAAGTFKVAGTASLAAGAKVGINLLSNLSLAPQTYTLIEAAMLDIGAVSGLAVQTPYLAIADLRVSGHALLADVRRRSAAEAQLNPGQTAAYEAVYAALGRDAGVQSAFTSAADRTSFVSLYDQMLPQYSGGLFRMVSLAARSVSAAAADASPVGGGWVQEIAFGARYDGDQANPYSGFGFGFAAGAERPTRLGRIGVSAAFMTGRLGAGDLTGDTRSDVTQLEAGAYWRASLGGLQFDARGGASRMDYAFKRQLLIQDADGETLLSRVAEAQAAGYALTGRVGVGYQLNLGRAYLRPGVHMDHLQLRRGAYTETGGGDAYDLAVQASTGSETSVTAALQLGALFGKDFKWRPEVEVGYRSVMSGDPGSTAAVYVAGGETFVLDPALLDGTTTARFSLHGGDESFDLNFSFGGEAASGYLEGDLKFRARLHF